MANGVSTRLREEPFDWVVRSLANVLGVPQTNIPLRRDKPLSLASDAEIGNLAGQLATRFVREEDPLTGQVSYSVYGPAIAIDVGETQVEELAHRATLVFPGVRAALAEIDSNVCRPGVCADDVRSLVDSSRAAIDQLDAELRGEAADPVVDTLFDELLADDRGWLALLAGKLDEGAGDPTDSVAHERQRTFLAITAEGLMGLQDAWQQYRNGGDDLGALLGQVERCAGHITEQSVAIRVLLSEYGIGRCELEAVMIELGDEVWIGGETYGRRYRTLSLADLLRHCERFGQRLPGLARLGRGYQLDTIRAPRGRWISWSRISMRGPQSRASFTWSGTAPRPQSRRSSGCAGWCAASSACSGLLATSAGMATAMVAGRKVDPAVAPEEAGAEAVVEAGRRADPEAVPDVPRAPPLRPSRQKRPMPTALRSRADPPPELTR